MALDAFLKYSNSALESDFSKPAFDAHKAREAIIKRLEKAEEQFTATEPSRGRKMYKVNNSVVELTLPFKVGGEVTHFIPSEQFQNALNALKTSVRKGEVDDQLITLSPAANATRTVATGLDRKPRKPMSEEAKAQMAARRKATMERNGTAPGRKSA